MTATFGNAPTPATPLNLSVGAGNTSLSVSWSASVNAMSYQVFRDTSSTGTFSTQVYTGSLTSFTDNGLGSSSTYYYKVQATNNSGSSPKSAYAWGNTNRLAFNLISTADIQAHALFAASIDGSDSNDLLPVNTILVYKTHGGYYGKLQVTGYTTNGTNAHYSITISWSTNGGSVSSITIPGTDSFNLETGLVNGSPADFTWAQTSATTRNLVPNNLATFAIY